MNPIRSVNAVVDIGNTAIKVCGVEEGQVQGEMLYFAPSFLPSLASSGPLFSAATVVIGCSGPATLATDLAAQIFARGGEAIVVKREGPLPFQSHYAPGQAGVDRLANVAAAIDMTGGEPAVIIDAGSAITIEMVARGGIFMGGVILPGFRLQAQALNRGTASLPLVDLSSADKAGHGEWEQAFVLPATNTQDAITGGVAMGCLGGIEKIVREYLRMDGMGSASLFVAGGDGAAIASQLDLSGCISCPRPATYDAHLTLKGLLLLAAAQQ